MTVETSTQHLPNLLSQMTDLLGLPRDIDLPPLYSVECRRTDGDAGWRLRGHLWQHGDERTWNDLSAWAHHAVGRIELGEEHGAPGANVRNASVTIVVGDISVEIWAAVSGAFIPPDTCCVESYKLGDACGGCQRASEDAQAAQPPVTVHAAGSQYDGWHGRAVERDEEGGYEVALPGADRPVHFEASEVEFTEDGESR